MDSLEQADRFNIEDRLGLSVRSVMRIEEVTYGRPEDGYFVKFRGQLSIDSELAYDRLEPLFTAQGLTLLFRKEGDEHMVLGIKGLQKPSPSNPAINLVLFVLTLLTVLAAGVLYGLEDISTIEEKGLILGILQQLPRGIPFAASLLAILLAHEFGHYLAARYHKTPVTLPYFLPFPGSLFGTLGAFIRLKALPKNRKVILDIGLAGPLAGLVVAVPVLIFGLLLSEVHYLPSTPIGMRGTSLEGNSILYLLSKWVVTGEFLPAPIDYGGSPIFYWIQYFFLGTPTPYGARDILLHPIAWAGWAGLLVTALNLIPAGQLDGGHVLYVLLGKNVRKLWPVIVIILLALGTVWSGWYLWAGLIFLLGRVHIQPLDDITPLDPRRRMLALFGLIVFVLVFTPIPLKGFAG